MRFKKAWTEVVLYTCLAFTCVGCSQRPTTNAEAVTPTASQNQQPPATVIPGLSVLDEERSSGFAAVPIVLKENVDLESVYFFNGSHGWAGGDGVLHKTTDGGKSWSRVPLEIPPRAAVSHISFINSSVGWVVLQRRAGVLNYRENRFWLIRTIDAGETWKIILEASESFAGALAFTDEKSGWLAGTKYVGISPVRYTYLLLRTDDQGENWRDVSDPLKRLTSERRNRAPDYINDGINGLVSDGPAQATVVTGESKVLETVNGGENWREVVSKLSDRLVIRRFGHLEDNRLFVVGARGGEEGTRGGIFMQQPDGSWVSRVLDGIFVKDVLFLPRNGLMASGYEERGEINRLVKRGIILHSSDGGEHWGVVYRNPQLGAFNALATNGFGCAWAVGENGQVIRLCPSRK